MMMNLEYLSFNKEGLLVTEDLIDELCGSSDCDKLQSGLRFIVTKSEISGRLFSHYGRSGAKSSSELCAPEFLLAAADLITRNIETINLSAVDRLKWLNAASKLIDQAVAQKTSTK